MRRSRFRLVGFLASLTLNCFHLTLHSFWNGSNSGAVNAARSADLGDSQEIFDGR
jgi:hypothetical protein